jgi:phenylacetate-coenzyme A ligase PaaK-like adenylate-forming protein
MTKSPYINSMDTQLEMTLSGSGPLAPRLARTRLLKLAETLNLAAHESAFYRNIAAAELKRVAEKLILAARNTISPNEAENLILEVLETLPLTTSEDVARSPESFLTVSQDEVEGLISLPTSGSLGLRKRIFSNREDLINTIEFFKYGMLNLINPDSGPRVGVMMSSFRSGSVGQLLFAAMHEHGVGCYMLDYLPEAPDLLKKWLKSLYIVSPTTLVGLPSQILYLARTSPKPKDLENILLSGETTPKGLIEALEKQWGTEVFVHFGMTEFGLGGAVECRAHKGPHLREADLVAEIIPFPDNPFASETGAADLGQLVLTSLSRRAMPLIRYQTGDLGRLESDPCPCGSVLRRLSVLGRKDDLTSVAKNCSLTLTDLNSLNEALYRLQYVTTFSAVFSRTPELNLNLNLGTIGEINDSWILEARLAIEAVLGQKFSLNIVMDPFASTPAVGGSKPSLIKFV